MLRKIALGMMVLAALSLAACATSDRTYQGAGAGAALGGLAGALLDSGNRWRGGVIGAAIGAAAVGSAVELSSRASREAAVQNQPVVYTTSEGSAANGKIVAEPIGTYQDGCKEVRTQVFEDGRLVKEEVKRVCP